MDYFQNTWKSENLIAALAQDFLNVYLVNPKEDLLKPIKLEGYVTSGIDLASNTEYPFQKLVGNYVQERVYLETRS